MKKKILVDKLEGVKEKKMFKNEVEIKNFMLENHV